MYIVDRAKDMVIRGGENVYCVEVEAVLFEHPGVADAAVIGVPHQVLGEEVGAVVQLAPGSAATADELQAHVAERLAAFKVPGASASATSRCRATPPARCSSATCATSSWVRVEPGEPRRRCPRRVPTPQRGVLGGEVLDDDGVLLWAGPNDAAIVVNGALRTAPNVRRVRSSSARRGSSGSGPAVTRFSAAPTSTETSSRCAGRAICVRSRRAVFRRWSCTNE